MFNLQGKVWGNTVELFNRNNVEIHRIEVVPGGYCSEHKHDSKYNAFYVESGQLVVKVWKSDYNLTDETVVNSGELTIVPPGEFHQFSTDCETVAYEIYWVELTKDIERRNEGGVLPHRHNGLK